MSKFFDRWGGWILLIAGMVLFGSMGFSISRFNQSEKTVTIEYGTTEPLLPLSEAGYVLHDGGWHDRISYVTGAGIQDYNLAGDHRVIEDGGDNPFTRWMCETTVSTYKGKKTGESKECVQELHVPLGEQDRFVSIH